jgi:glycosyltransferase involved in cell wall biosynthesis
VDDGSRDGTAEAVRAWARGRALPVRLLAQAQAGAGAARNLGLGHTDADLVALLDADDVFLPHHLARAEAAFARHPELVLYFANAELFSPAGVVKADFLAGTPLHGLPLRAGGDGLQLLGGSVYASLVGGSYMPVSTTVLARAAVLRVGGYDRRFVNAADRDLNLRLSRAGPFACRLEVSARKRLRDDSLSHPRHGLRAMRYRIAVLRKMLAQARALGLSAAEREATRAALREHADALLYGASREGLGPFAAAWAFALRNAAFAAAARPRHALRACAATAGLLRGGAEACEPVADRSAAR